jgi:WD40 repeat protein
MIAQSQTISTKSRAEYCPALDFHHPLTPERVLTMTTRKFFQRRSCNLCVVCLALMFLSGCGNKALIETAKTDLRDFSGSANPKDYLDSKKSDFKAWKKTAAKGIPEGQVLYGLCYANGVKVRENKPESVKWFRKAAEQGNADGQYQLGRCYWRGEGIPEDKAEGVKWLYKAKEQGHGEADVLFQITKDKSRVNIVPVALRMTDDKTTAAVQPAIANEVSGNDSAFIELEGHTRSVESVSFSPDGKKVVTGSWDDTARIWDAESGKELVKLEGRTGDVWSVAFSPDGKKVVTGSEDRTARIWDAESGKELAKLEGHTDRVRSVSFSPDGKKVVTGSDDRTVRIWDAESGKELAKLEGHTSRVESVAFSPDGKKVVTGSTDMTARIWDAESGKELAKLEGRTGDVWSVAFSPDGKKVVTGSEDRTARIWDAESGKELAKLEGHTKCVNSAAFSPDGKKVVTGSEDKTARIWDAESGKELAKLEGHTRSVESVAFSPDGKKVVTGSEDKTARIWDFSAIEARLVAKAKVEEEKRQTFLATGAVILEEELRKSGFSELSDYVQFGTSTQKNILQRADAFDKADAEAKIKTAMTEMAKKTYAGEYTYTTSNVQVDGDKSSFTMTIPAGFISTKINEVVLPFPNVTGKLGSTGRRATSPMLDDYAILVKDDAIVYIRRAGGDTFYTKDGGRMPDNIPRDTDGRMIPYVRYGNPSQIVLTIIGSTNSIRELVRNSDNYQARIWFTNLRYASNRENVKYWRVSGQDMETEVSGGEYPNPFVLSKEETVESVLADIVKIEIIKAK